MDRGVLFYLAAPSRIWRQQRAAASSILQQDDCKVIPRS
jgi:hypothetical protein